MHSIAEALSRGEAKFLDGIRHRTQIETLEAFPRECTEAFQEGHRRAFEFFGAVPTRISYDNSRVAIAKITGSHFRWRDWANWGNACRGSAFQRLITKTKKPSP